MREQAFKVELALDLSEQSDGWHIVVTLTSSMPLRPWLKGPWSRGPFASRKCAASEAEHVVLPAIEQVLARAASKLHRAEVRARLVSVYQGRHLRRDRLDS